MVRARSPKVALFFLVTAGFLVAAACDDDSYTQDRRNMVLRQIEARGVKDQRVLGVMLQVPRHRFIPPDRIQLAYQDAPLPIGYGQTISQPYVVAGMTELL